MYLTARFLMFRHYWMLLPDTFYGLLIHNTDSHNIIPEKVLCLLLCSQCWKRHVCRWSVIQNETLKLGIDTCTSEIVFMRSITSHLNEHKLCFVYKFASYNKPTYTRDLKVTAILPYICKTMVMVCHKVNCFLTHDGAASCFYLWW